MSCFWIDIDLPFHAFWKILVPYSRFSKNPFHVFEKILVPYSRFSRIVKTDLHDCRRPSFPTCSFFGVPKCWDSQNHVLSRMIRGAFLNFLGIFWRLQRYIILVLGVMDMPRNPKTIRMMICHIYSFYHAVRACEERLVSCRHRCSEIPRHKLVGGWSSLIAVARDTLYPIQQRVPRLRHAAERGHSQEFVQTMLCHATCCDLERRPCS